jgi:tetratricopeptide (TPR) repeat protein
MTLNGSDLEQLRDAFVMVYDADSLREFLRFRLDRRLDSYITPNATFPNAVFQVLDHAQKERWLRRLVARAAEFRADVAEFVNLCQRILDQYPPDSDPTKGPRLFRDDNTVNILLLPFDAMEKVTTKDIRPERAILMRLSDLQHEQNLALQIQYISIPDLPTSFTDGVAIGRDHGADLVIWGDYFQTSSNDETRVRLRWALVDFHLPIIDKVGKTPIEPVNNISLLSEGYLQYDIDFVIYWCLVHTEMKMAHYQQAVEQLNLIVERFGNKFEGIVSFQLDGNGMNFHISRPTVQLAFYFGYCYQRLKQYDRAIPCWDHILYGSTKRTGGSSMAWNTMAIAISRGNPDEVQALLQVLLSKAEAISMTTGIEGAFPVLQEVFTYARSAESNSTLYNAVFADVVQWLSKELNLSGSERSSSLPLIESLRTMYRRPRRHS